VSLEIETLFAIAGLAVDQQGYGLANLHYDLAARVILRSKRELTRLCEALGERALILRRLRRYDEALELAKKAVEAAEAHGGPAQVAKWTGEMGGIYLVSKDPDAARHAFERARDEYRSLGDAGRAGLAQQEGNLGLLAHEAGDEPVAEAAYRRAHEAATAAGDRSIALTWEINLARALARRRLYREAWEHFSHARDVASGLGQDERLVEVATSWANALGLAWRPAEAAAVSLSTASMVRRPDGRADLLDDAIEHLRMAEDWTQLLETGKELTALLRQLGDANNRIDVVAGRMKEATGRRAAAAVRGTSGHAGPLPFEDYVIAAMTHFQKQHDAPRMGQVAHLICDVALGLADPSEYGWKALMEQAGLRYRIVVDACQALMEIEKPLLSLEISQRMKCIGFCRQTLERLSENGGHGPEVTSYLTAWRSLGTAVAALKEATLSNIQSRCGAVRAAGEMLLEAGEYVRQQDPILHARLGGLVHPQDLLDGLPVDSPVGIVDLLVGPFGTVVHILHRVGDEVRVAPGLAKEFAGEDAARLIELWLANGGAHEISRRQGEALGEISRTLHDKLFCSLASTLAGIPVTQIVLVPDMVLAPLPLHLAAVCDKNVRAIVDSIREVRRPDSVNFLCEAFPVEYSTCLQAIAASQYQKFPREISRVAALSDPRDDLPGARATADWLAEHIGDRSRLTSLVGADARKAALLASLEGADVLVISTHGTFVGNEPDRSHLVFSDADWTLAEMLDQRPLSRGPVVVLSACEIGASGLASDPREASGIPGALLSAGAGAVLAPLWPAEDFSTGILVESFIRHLSRRGLRPSAALWRAALDVKTMTKEQATERCDRLIHVIRRQSPSPARSRQVLMIDHLRDWIDGQDAACPFTSPQFWGGAVVVGSGWHSPAGASVGNAESLASLMTDAATRLDARRMLGEGRFGEARKILEDLLPRSDGNQRAATLDALAWAVWGTRIEGAEGAAEQEATALLNSAETLARSEQDEQLLRNITATRAKIALYRRNDVEADNE
jgi:CHAT domain-containing protein/tetratricopeptide (TPR) repeat protein